MTLKPQDVLVLLKLLALGEQPWAYAPLSVDLGMSSSQLHSAVQRVLRARLAVRQDERVVPQQRNLEEFLIHGVKYAFVPERGELTRGIPTSYAASPLREHFVGDNEPPPVWPDPLGNVRGQAFSPIYKLAPQAALRDERLYELLVIVDGIRGGRAREQKIAIDELQQRMAVYG